MFPALQEERTQLQFVTNPYSFEIEGLRVIGTNGSNVKDMRMYCKGFKDKPLEALEQTLRMRILYPTCPDTLRGYPVKNDPFLLKSAPDIYFAGNQPYFETKLCQNGTRLISLPCFRRTK